MKLALSALLVALPLAAEAGPVGGLDALRLDDLSATRERPLFAPTRRPPPPVVVPAPALATPVVAQPPAPPAAPPYDLVGTAIGARDAFALLRDRSSHDITRLRLGEVANGWRLKAIDRRSIALERDGRTDDLALAGPEPEPGMELADEARAAAEPPPAPAPAARKWRRPETP